MKKLLNVLFVGFTAVICVLFSSPALALEVKVEVFASGLQSPVDLKEVPDGSGRIFIMQQTGAIVVINADGSIRPEPFLDLRAKIIDPYVALTSAVHWGSPSTLITRKTVSSMSIQAATQFGMKRICYMKFSVTTPHMCLSSLCLRTLMLLMPVQNGC